MPPGQREKYAGWPWGRKCPLEIIVFANIADFLNNSKRTNGDP
jgi:hypothetical protein